MKIAVVHDWLATHAGSERVLEQILQVFPEADLFCLFDILPEKERSFLGGKKTKTSFIQKMPFKKQFYRRYLPLMPLAVEQFDLSAYDLIVSNCHAVSKGIITGPGQLHISYILTPIRYAWEMQNEYLTASRPGWLKNIMMRVVLHYIRLWDVAAAGRPDVILASSTFIAERIRKFYRRESQVVYPPVDTETFTCQERKADYYLAASRLVTYKRLDLIMEAFRAMPEKKLVVIGDGPDREKIKNLTAPNIQWLGYQSTDNLRKYMQEARALIFAAKEDFGIIPLEAQACGTPVIAFREGGVRETIRDLDHPKPTGVLFSEQTSHSIQEAVRLFESVSERIKPQTCRANTERFSNSRFRQEFSDQIHKAWNDFQKRK